MERKILIRIFQSLTGVLLGLALVFLVLRPGDADPEGEQASYFLPDPIQAPPFNLRSHQGSPVSSEEVTAELTALFFGYTSCPDVCPLTLAHLARALEEMGEDAGRVQVYFVTVDPERDTPDRLGQYLASFHSSFVGLTGSEEEIRAVADGFGVFFARTGSGPDYTVDHTARTFVMDRSGGIRLSFPVTATPEEMARDLALLLETLT